MLNLELAVVEKRTLVNHARVQFDGDWSSYYL